MPTCALSDNRANDQILSETSLPFPQSAGMLIGGQVVAKEPYKTELTFPVEHTVDQTKTAKSREAGLIEEVLGTVFDIEGAVIFTKLNDGIVVGLPEQLFAFERPQIGQSVRYQIRFDDWGYKYQTVVLDETTTSADVSDLEEILKDILE